MTEFFSLPFVQTALIVSLCSGIVLSWIGTFLLARRAAFSGLSVAQLAVLGTVIGSLGSRHGGEYAAALMIVAAGLIFYSLLSSGLTNAPQDSWIASFYVLGAGLAVLILSKAPLGEARAMSLFFGNVLSLGWHEVVESIVLLAVSFIVFWAWLHRWVLLVFDPLSAEIAGLRVHYWNLLFYLLLAASMTLAIHNFGVLLAFSYLLLPASIGLLLVRSLNRLFVVVAGITAAVTTFGFYASFYLDFPTGPFVASCFAVLVLMVGCGRLLIQRLRL
ncbi:MAG: metal ABC transporter permease [Elusimicrobia bacterium]|nr:metal ABC transporter permease [Elusimicrobiota bacterium]